MGKTVSPDNCPDPSVHGNPFRYCPFCSWIEEPVSKPNKPINDESPILPSVGNPPPVKKYDMSLNIATDVCHSMSRDLFITMTEVQVENLARHMIRKMVEDYDVANNPVRPDTVTS